MKPRVILLEHPRIESEAHYNDVANAPLSSCVMSGYVASVLQQHDYSAEICDCYLAGETFEQCYRKLAALDFNVLGVHAVYFWEHTPELFLFLRRFKALRPEVPLIIYGLFPTFAYKEILTQHPFIDAVIIGEPEETFYELMSSYRNQTILPQKIAGLACLEKGEINVTHSRPAIEHLDAVPFPFRYEASLKMIGGSILGSRGCCGTCSFCCIQHFYGPKACWRSRSPENIASEIELLLPRLDKKYIYFLDADFFGKGKKGMQRASEIADRIKGFSLQFGIESRCNDIDKHLLAKLADAGLTDVFLGIESASAASLKRMKKNLPADKAAAALGLLRSVGIEPSPGFIMFEPASSLADIRENYDFLKANGLLNRLSTTANVLYHREILLRGTDDFLKFNASGQLLKKDCLEYEGFYAFTDQSVQFLADLMSAVCRRILRFMASTHSPLCWKSGEGRAAGNVNEYLAGLFEATLRKLELKSLACDAGSLLALEEDALNYIEGLIVEERICQA